MILLIPIIILLIPIILYLFQPPTLPPPTYKNAGKYTYRDETGVCYKYYAVFNQG